MSNKGSPLALVHERVDAAIEAAEAGDGNSAVHGLLDAFAALGRHVAQVSWTLRHDDPDRDDLMEEDESDLVLEVMKMPLVAKIYPEFPSQAENVLRETFQDEHFRLEDPLGWEEMNRDPDADEARR